MNETNTRRLLCAETFLLTFAVGGFLTLPLVLTGMGRTEVFFAQVYAAGAVGAIGCVLATPWLLGRVGLARLAPWGSLSFFAGSLMYAMAIRHNLCDLAYYAASLVQGVGWGLFLTQGPICLSAVVDPARRTYHFTIYGAYNTLGLGLAPILSRWATSWPGIAYEEFYFLSVAASALAFAASAFAARGNKAYAAASHATGTLSSESRKPRMRDVLAHPSIYFVAMVFMCACVFTSMMNFQATFATANHIDYTIFYGFYSLAVVLSRFFLSRPLSGLHVRWSVPALAALMLLSIGILFLARSSVIFYGGGALLLGVGYGLLYPTIQAQAANGVPAHLRPQALILFSLSYMVARYLFPYIGAQTVLLAGYDGLLAALAVSAGANVALAAYFYVVGPGKPAAGGLASGTVGP